MITLILTLRSKNLLHESWYQERWLQFRLIVILNLWPRKELAFMSTVAITTLGKCKFNVFVPLYYHNQENLLFEEREVSVSLKNFNIQINNIVPCPIIENIVYKHRTEQKVNLIKHITLITSITTP